MAELPPVKIRFLGLNDLAGLLRLYRFLNPRDPVLAEESPDVRDQWQAVLRDERLSYFGSEIDGVVVSTCTLCIVPNFTRSMRPYGVIENVVTDPAYRMKGLGTAILRHALEFSWTKGCYKVMLATGSKREETLRFYEKAGFKRGVKTGFVAHPDGQNPS